MERFETANVNKPSPGSQLIPRVIDVRIRNFSHARVFYLALLPGVVYETRSRVVYDGAAMHISIILNTKRSVDILAPTLLLLEIIRDFAQDTRVSISILNRAKFGSKVFRVFSPFFLHSLANNAFHVTKSY